VFDAADLIDAPLTAPHPIAPKGAPEALQSLQPAGAGPHLIFPPDGAMVEADGFGPSSRGLALAARGEGLSWYVDGAPLAADADTGRVVWKPAAPGFYRLTVVDKDGRRAEAKVRIRGG